MSLEEITVSVDSDIATVYRAATEAEACKLNVLVNLPLREATRPKQSLKEAAAEISRKARQRGLTSEILKSILDEG